MHRLSLIVGKTVLWLLRHTGRTGSALPGLVVEKIDPGFLPLMLSTLPQGVVIISGTNGKTTTTKIVTKLLESQGLKVLTNPTGSNFVRGIISVVVDAARGGKLDYDIAVFEQDEAHAVHLAKQVQPRAVLVLNVMRDQMDRFGEIDTTTKLLQSLVSATTETVVLNANDERVSKITPPAGASLQWYGHAADLQKEFLTDDQLYHTESSAFFEAAKPVVKLEGYDATSVSLSMAGTPHRFNYSLTGGHNALNLTAAMCLVHSLVADISYDALVTAITTIEPAFGRGEAVRLDEHTTMTIQLVKNPGGFTQALRMLHVKQYDTVGIAINDDYPDGRDVSWLWDVSFTGIQLPVFCGGVRAADIANRLKYDDVNTASVEGDIHLYLTNFIRQAKETGGDAILFCTYTAMLQLRADFLGGISGLEGAES